MKGVTTAVDPATQALTATVELPETSHSLVYRSDTVQGSAGATTVRVPIERNQLPEGTHRVDLMVSVDGVTAQHLVCEFTDADVVTPVPEDCVLVHEPSGTAFDSSTQLTVFHRGWTAGRDADEEAE